MGQGFDLIEKTVSVIQLPEQLEIRAFAEAPGYRAGVQDPDLLFN